MEVDGEFAAKARALGCGKCGGRLDSARYPRKPRGAPLKLPAGYESRLSFCCAKCRCRVTPASVRYLGRKVYLGAVVVLATAMRQGVTPARAKDLKKLFGVGERTLARWRWWWREAFAKSPFWKRTRGLQARPSRAEELPRSLLECFAGEEEKRLVSLLRLLSPVTTSSATGAMAF